MIKLLIGGSPCTYWSIAQKNNRETEPSGLGWELFKNYAVAKEKFNPNFFLYENNKSASQAIKRKICDILNVWDGTLTTPCTDARYIEINSALVSAQNRQRFYVHNCGEVEQPKDRCILLNDILETNDGREPQRIPKYSKDKSRPLNAYYSNNCGGFEKRIWNDNPDKQQVDLIAEPVKYLNDKNMENLMRPYGSKGKICNKETEKSPTLMAATGADGGNAIYYADNVMKVKEATKKGYCEISPSECVDPSQENSKTRRGRAMKDKSNCLTTTNEFYQYCGTINQPIYKVKDEQITIKGKQYPIKLKDGYYIIRKLTVTECCRLQTMPDNYCRAVSNTQAYKGLGNGWTAEVIIHILSNALKNVPKDEKIVVLSMYDGIGTGRYVLDKMGFTNIEYHAFEIDKYAMQISMSNYPDIIQHGDAFQVREDNFLDLLKEKK